MSIKIITYDKKLEDNKIIKCKKLTNDIIFMKYDVKVGDIIDVNGEEFVVLINKGEVYDVKDKCGKYIIIEEKTDSNIKEQWKDLHIRKTENDEICIIYLNRNIIKHNKYSINDPIKYINFNKEGSEIYIKLEGYYDFKIENPKMFLSKIIGIRKHFTKQELIEKIRKYILKSIEKGINEISEEYKLNIEDLPEKSKKLEIKLKQNEYDEKLLEYGVKLTYFDINKFEITNKKNKFFKNNS